MLALVNNDPKCGSLDLIGVVTGNLLLDDWRNAPIYMKYAKGIVSKDMEAIDLIAWYDAYRADKLFF